MSEQSIDQAQSVDYAARFEAMSEEQQFYNLLRMHNKELYKLRDLALQAQDSALKGTEPQAFQTAQQVNQMSQIVTKAVSTSYRWQKDMEEKHPEFKQEAIEFAKSLKQQHDLTRKQKAKQQQSF